MWYPMRIKAEESRERSRLLERVTDIRGDTAGRPTFSERKVSPRREKKEVWYLRGK